MKKKEILVVVGSVRQQRAADGVLGLVKSYLEERQSGVNMVVADLRELNLPMIDSSIMPSSDDFVPQHDSVKTWQELVSSADTVIMLTPEYNSGIAPAQKNAIDWLYHDWQKKPVIVVGYGWGGAVHARHHLSDVLKRVGAQEMTPAVSLNFEKEIALDGSALDGSRATELLAPISKLIGQL